MVIGPTGAHRPAQMDPITEASITPTASPSVEPNSQNSSSLRRSGRPKPSPQSLRSSPPAIKFYESTRVKPIATLSAVKKPTAIKPSALANEEQALVSTSLKLRLPQRSPSPSTKTRVVKLMMPTLEAMDSPSTRNLPPIAPKPTTAPSTSLLGKLSLRLFGSSNSSLLSVEEVTTTNNTSASVNVSRSASVQPTTITTAKEINEPQSSQSTPSMPIVNDDHCAACNGTGNFICCDSCPRSFHFTCAEPPLDPQNLPEDDWFCSECLSGKADFQPQQPTGTAFLDIWSQMFSQIQRSNPKAFILPKRFRTCKEESHEVMFSNEASPKLTASTPNAPQPANLTKRKSNHSSGSQSIVVGNSIITAAGIKAPSIAHLKSTRGFCHQCGQCGLTRRALEASAEDSSFSFDPRHSQPILSCSICPLYFHLDCLDPPMTALPPAQQCDRWTCPLHFTKERCLALELAEPLVAACHLLPESAIRLQFTHKRRRLLEESPETVDEEDSFEEKMFACKSVSVPAAIKTAYHN